MTGLDRVVKQSCPFCRHPDRDALEEKLLHGVISCKDLDKEMNWRVNTSDRHFRNHMGQYHMGANPSCVICASPKRGDYEHRYFNDGSESDAIAKELEIPESTVYHHMKHHFQPLVQQSSALEVSKIAGNEITTLRGNVEKLNHKLSELIDEGSVHDDGFVRDAVQLHKEVRESIKDLLRFQDEWGPSTENQQINNTINILQVELANESPETWSRVKANLLNKMGVEQ
tara:strand:+ start:139 stop:822 length:684 start_codon:yes stop_codon:yes gene_type:complete